MPIFLEYLADHAIYCIMWGRGWWGKTISEKKLNLFETFESFENKNSDIFEQKISTNVENKHIKHNKDIVKYGQNVKHSNIYISIMTDF